MPTKHTKTNESFIEFSNISFVSWALNVLLQQTRSELERGFAFATEHPCNLFLTRFPVTLRKLENVRPRETSFVTTKCEEAIAATCGRWVMQITHLPQVAATASSHFVVARMSHAAERFPICVKSLGNRDRRSSHACSAARANRRLSSLRAC